MQEEAQSQEDLVIRTQTFNKFLHVIKILGPRLEVYLYLKKDVRWGCFDYNQQEPRLVVHYAALYKLPSVYDVLDSYKENIKSDFHQTVADMAEIPRSSQDN